MKENLCDFCGRPLSPCPECEHSCYCAGCDECDLHGPGEYRAARRRLQPWAPIRNLGKAISALAIFEARERIMHADVDAMGAPGECHGTICASELQRRRAAIEKAEAIAGAPYHEIARQASRRGLPLEASPQYERLVGSVIARIGGPEV